MACSVLQLIEIRRLVILNGGRAGVRDLTSAAAGTIMTGMYQRNAGCGIPSTALRIADCRRGPSDGSRRPQDDILYKVSLSHGKTKGRPQAA
jgi:hypothetical protein